MEYLWRAATGPLAEVVSGLWFLRGPSPARIERILPMPQAHLIVNLAEAPYRVRSLSDPQWRVLGDAFCSGLRGEVAFSANPDPIVNVGAVVRADGLPGLGLDPAALAASVDTVALPAPVPTQEPSPQELLDVLAETLLNRLVPDPVDPVVRRVLSALTTEPGVPIAQLARAEGVGHPALVARFRRQTGTTPKRYGELVRLHRMIDRIPVPHWVSWSELAAASGYYDQSHAIRSFRRFTGLTPAAYYRRVRESGPDAVRFVPEAELPG